MGRLLAKIRGARRSLTVWFNGLAGSALVALPFAQDNLPQLQAYIAPDAYRYLMGAVVAANILLRFRTSQPLEGK